MAISVKKEYIEDFWDLADVFAEEYSECEEGMCYIGDFKNCADLLKGIITFDDCDDLSIYSIELCNPDMDCYEGPYMITVTQDGEIFCGKAIWKDDKFYCTECDVVYVQPEYLKKAIDSNCNFDAQIFCTYVGDECFEDAEDDVPSGKLSIIQGDDGKPRGFAYHEEVDGECFDYTYCSCEPMSFEDVTDKFNKIIERFKG